MTIVSQKLPSLEASFALAYDDAVHRAMHPGALTRLRARLQGGGLDRALIDGADPASRPELAARASLLNSRHNRGALADGVDRLVAAAHGPHRRWWALSRYDGVLANAAELRDLATLLRSNVPLYARGIALLRDTLADGLGPAYRGGPTALARRLSDVRAALGND